MSILSTATLTEAIMEFLSYCGKLFGYNLKLGYVISFKLFNFLPYTSFYIQAYTL